MNNKLILGISMILMASALSLHAQAPPTQSGSTQVMVIMTVKPGQTRDQIMKVMPEEVRATVRLYLDGKIQQWYGRGDGKGVIFILNVKQVSEAEALMSELPLAKGKFVDDECIPIGPLTPLGMLLGPATP